MLLEPEETTGINLRFFSIAIGVAIVHFSSGIIILINAKALHTTPLSLLAHVLSEKPWAVSCVLIVISVLAVLPFILRTKSHWVFVLLVAPQQILFLAHFTSAFLAIMAGQYPDGLKKCPSFFAPGPNQLRVSNAGLGGRCDPPISFVFLLRRSR
jgi:hypothetical protein